ncbi:MAG: D-tyrosyl-tRNA(Tyr) deacylase [Deltaproteobacteria bacterium]|nr:D-tyrosyl-tRNA(Tyr) deacylase [Deltaproteobacteria bacterium]
MKAVLQRVTRASVSVDGRVTGRIGNGLLVLVGAARGDEPEDADYLADRVVHMRIFEDDQGRMNRSLLDVGGAMLVVSQFTLLADTSQGRRPSFFEAMPPDQAVPLLETFVQAVQKRGIGVEQGVFRAMMDVELLNQGPVTILLDSGQRRGRKPPPQGGPRC